MVFRVFLLTLLKFVAKREDLYMVLVEHLVEKTGILKSRKICHRDFPEAGSGSYCYIAEV
jgi:hypothetical protein